MTIENKNLVNKYFIIKDILFSDFMKDEDGKIILYNSYDQAIDVCGMYEFEDVLICKVIHNHKDVFAPENIEENKKPDLPNLTNDEFTLSNKIVDDSLKIENVNLKKYITENLDNFIQKLNFDNFNDKRKINLFINRMKMLYLNYEINHNSYFLNEIQRQNASDGMSILNELKNDLSKKINY